MFSVDHGALFVGQTITLVSIALRHYFGSTVCLALHSHCTHVFLGREREKESEKDKSIGARFVISPSEMPLTTDERMQHQ